jgi:hypothetical protein
VVAFAPVGGAVAAGEAAVAVADAEGVPHGGWDGAGGLAVVDDRFVAVHDDAPEVGIAQQPEGGFGAEDGAVEGFGRGPGGHELVVVEDQVQVGPVPAPRGGAVLVVEEEPAQIRQRIGPLGGRCADRFAVAVPALGQAEGGGE